MADVESKYIIPPWQIIKRETLLAFYRCNYFLSQFRIVHLKKNINPNQVAYKEEMWLSFASELISLYMMLRTTLKENKKTIEHYTQLRELSGYALDMSKLTYTLGIKFYLIMEEALYKLGILNISLDEEDPTKAVDREINI